MELRVTRNQGNPSHRPVFSGQTETQGYPDPKVEVKKYRDTWPLIKKIGSYLLVAIFAILLSRAVINWYNGRLTACVAPKGYESFVGEATNPTDGNIHVIRSIYPNGDGTSGQSLLLVFSLCGSPDRGFQVKNNYKVTKSDGTSITLSTVVYQVESEGDSSPLTMAP